MRERRQHQRQTPKEFLTVYDCLTNEAIGGLANLSSKGAMFVTPEPIQATTTYRCRVKLPLPILGREDIIFDAECRWCRKNVKADRWESGFKLRMTGIDAELYQWLALGFKFGGWGDQSIYDVMTIEMESRRKSDRYELEETLPVFEQHNYRQIGELTDLSTEGVRLVTQKPIDKDDLLYCRVMLPRQVYQQDYLIFDAKCMWCRKGREGAHYESGHRIVNISEQDAAILLHLLVHHAEAQQTKKRIKVVH